MSKTIKKLYRFCEIKRKIALFLESYTGMLKDSRIRGFRRTKNYFLKNIFNIHIIEYK